MPRPDAEIVKAIEGSFQSKNTSGGEATNVVDALKSIASAILDLAQAIREGREQPTE
jgi:hypothetical protein